MPKKNFVEKLQEGVLTCRRLTEPMRMKRQVMLEEYANGYFGNTLKFSKKPLNMVFRGMSIMVPLLASNNPKAMVRARVAPLLPFSKTLELTINHTIREINLIQTLRGAITNSMMYMGITKSGISPGGTEVEDAYGYLHDAGQFYCDSVDGDDYIWDVAATVKEEMDFEGNRYRLPMQYIQESGLFKNFDDLEQKYHEYGEKNKRPEDIAKETIKNFEINELWPYAELYDIWVPEENKIYTIAPDGQGDKALREVEYEGPEGGPYDLLYYHCFPESIVPIPPIFSSLDLHHYINTMARKMGRQADREKTILAYEGQAEQDAKTVIEAEDGESVRVDNIDRLKELKYGGIPDQNYQWIGWLKQMWSEHMGNADLLGGLRPQAETLGQEQMLQANATIGVEDMVWQVHNFTKKILSKMAWYIWTDPLIDITVSKRIPGVVDLDVQFTEEAREGDFLDYNIDVEPYSMSRMNPEIRSQKIMQLVQAIILPTLQIAAQQGAIPDIPALVKTISRDFDLTEAEVDAWFKTAAPPNADLGPYQPMQGQVVKSGQGDDRFGASGASKMSNMNQQQTRAGMQSSPAQK